MMRHYLLTSALALGILSFLPLPASANYDLVPLSGGLSSKIVSPGSTFDLDLVLNSTATPPDSHLAAVFTVDFSQAGLLYNSHVWGAPYSTTSIDNNSKPSNSSLPVALSKNSYVAGFQDAGTVDVYFENFTDTPFSTGRIVTLDLTVPSTFPGGQVTIRALPDSFDNGVSSIPLDGGGNFTLIVTPEPSSLALAAIGTLLVAWTLSRRRRS
jgi:hypothetical protein